MIALMLSIAVCAAQPKELTWQQALDKIAPYMAGFTLDRDRETNTERMNAVFKHSGLHVFDFEGDRNGSGYYVNYESGVVKIKGMSAYLVRINRVSHDSDSVLALFERSSSNYKGTILQHNKEDYEISCYSAYRSGSLMVMLGQYCWYSNAPQPTVQLWKLLGNKWKQVDEKVAPFQDTGSDGVSVDKGGNFVIAPLEGRAYPRYLSACHATAQLAFRMKVFVRNGRLHTAWIRQINSPFNLLDRLYHSISTGNKAAIEMSCTTQLVAQYVLALRRKTTQGTPSIDFVNSYCNTYSRQIAVQNLGVWFHFAKKNDKWVVAKLTPYHEE